MIELLNNKEIDRDWWDQHIYASPVNDPYPYSWFMDIMCPGWLAYFDESINAVMPVPRYKKGFIGYIHTPSYVQRLGVYYPGTNKPGVDIRFIEKLSSDFRLVDLCVHSNPGISGTGHQKRSNYYLNLDQQYNQLYEDFTAKCKRDIRLAKESNPGFVSGVPSADAIDLFLKGPGKYVTGLRRNDYSRLQKLMEYCKSTGKGEVLGVYKNKSLIYSLFYIVHAGKLTALFISTSSKSRTDRSGYFVINHLLEEYADSSIVYDFAGSSIKGVEKFILSFGSIKEEYFCIYSNRLRMPLRQLVEYRRKRAIL